MVTHCVYHYRPLSIRSLTDLIAYEVVGETRRFQRNVANSLWIMAVGGKYDGRDYKPYTSDMDAIYCNPFVRGDPQTAEQIIAHVMDMLTEGGEEDEPI